MSREEHRRSERAWQRHNAVLSRYQHEQPSGHEITEYERLREEWLAAPKDCRPCNREEGEHAVRSAYRAARLDEPSTIVWMDSPLGALVALYALQNRLERPPGGKSFRRRRFRSETGLIDRQWQAACRRLDGVHAESVKVVTRTFTWPLIETPIMAMMTLTGDDSRGVSVRGKLLNQKLDSPLRRVGTAREPLHRQLRADFPTSALATDDYGWARPIDPWTTGPRVALFAGALFHEGGNPKVDALADVVKKTGAVWITPSVAVLSDRPRRVCYDDEYRLHNDQGAALEYADGFVVHARHGRHVPAP